MTATAAPEPNTSVWEDFVDIFYAPSTVFAQRDGRFGIALAVLTVVMAGLFFSSQAVLSPAFDAEWGRASERLLRENPNLTAEQLQQGQGMREMFGLVGFVVSFPIAVVVIGALLWLIGKLFDANQGFATALMVATYSQFPKILSQIVALVQGLLLDPSSLDGMYRVSLSPARFLDPDTVSPIIIALAGRFDAFVIWSTALLAIGLAVTGRIPKLQAAIAATLVWLLAAIPAVLGAAGAAG